MLNDKRIRIFIGHYGSGKTEIAMNYALMLADISKEKIAIGDLDIVNPYFRIREKAGILEKKGIETISSVVGNKYSNADIPMIAADILKLFQDKSIQAIIDVGGDGAGAKPLVRYKKELLRNDYDMFAVINGYRMETSTVEGAIKHIEDIEAITGLKVTGLINNSHLIKETIIENIVFGQELVKDISEKLNIPIRYVGVLEKLVNEVKGIDGEIIPIKLYMREEWM